MIPLYDIDHGPCIQSYNFESDDSPVKLAGASTFTPRLQAKFALPFDEAYGLEIESEPPILSVQPRSSRRTSLTRRTPSPRKFYTQNTSTLLAIRFTCSYSEEEEEDSTHFLLIAHSETFSQRESTTDHVVPWIEWRSAARLTLDGFRSPEVADRRNVFACNVSTDRVVVIDREENSATVRVLDFNRMRFRNMIRSQNTPLINSNGEVLQSSTPMKVVTTEPSESDGLVESIIEANVRSTGLSFIEMTMPRRFASMAGAIILEEHLFVLTQVGELYAMNKTI